MLGPSSAAGADALVNCFVPEFLAAYTDVKIVLVERDVEAWYGSFERTALDGLIGPTSRLGSYRRAVWNCAQRVGPWVLAASAIVRELVMDEMIGGFVSYEKTS